MTKAELLLLTKEAALERLNKDYADKGADILDLFSESEREEYEGICAECYGQTEEKSRGDEGWTVCEGCQSVEGKTLEITVVPALGLAYNWTQDRWMVADDSIGQTM